MNNGEGETVSVPVEASDPDGLPLTFGATGLPPGLSIDPATGLISGAIASGDDTGTPYDVIVSVSNGSKSSTLEFPWTITRVSLQTPADQSSLTGDVVSLPIGATAPVGDSLTYGADGLPDGLSIDPVTGIISGVLAASAAGMPWAVTLDVTDGSETTERTFNWTVLPASPAGVVSVADSSFEAVNVGAGNYQPDPTGSAWAFSNASGVTGNGSGFTSSNPPAPQGTQVAFLQGTGSFSQSVSGWAAGSYTISFDAALRGNYGGVQNFEVLVDGNLVGSFEPTTTSYQSYTTGPFTVAAGSHTIEFLGVNTAGGDDSDLLDALSVAVVAPAVPAVGDAGFEQSPVGSGYAYDPSGSAWTFSNSSGVTGNNSAFTSGNPPAPQGTQVAFLQEYASMSQAVASWAAGTYTLAFDAAQRGNNPIPPAEDFQVLVDGVAVGTFRPTDTTYRTYSTASFPVTAGTHTITFQGLDSAGGDNTAFIDQVSVAQQGVETLPTITLANPGDQVNYTEDVISLPIPANASATDDLYYSASGLPEGLAIDPATGIIAGMDDDFNAPAGTVYAVTVTVTDDYGQSTSQTFHWQFNTDPAGPPALGPFADGAGGVSGSGGASPLGLPGQHPTSEARTDAFDVNAFWSNVEKLPGGQAAENWVADHGGKVEWAWLGITTLGRYEQQADGTSIPVVYIPQRYNEADAATAFVNNITQTWDGTGFAAESQIPTDGNPVTMQSYLKARTAAMGSVVTTGAEIYLSGLSIVNEGADWVITASEVASSKSIGQAALASMGFLPFISGGTIKVVKGASQVVFTCTTRQLNKIQSFLKDFATLFPNVKVFTSVDDQAGTAIIQRSDLVFSKENILQMSRGNAPFIRNANGDYTRVTLHHVEKEPETVDDVLAELIDFENHPKNLLHTQYPEAGVKYGQAWKDFKAQYWDNRLQQAINDGIISQSVIDPLKQTLIACGFTFPP